MAAIEYFIKVDLNGNATVHRTPNVDFAAFKFKRNVDEVNFKSNKADTVIRYRGTSPFAEPQLGPDKVFPVGDVARGPFVAVYNGDHHFDCGRMIHGVFSAWPVGDDTPVET